LVSGKTYRINNLKILVSSATLLAENLVLKKARKQKTPSRVFFNLVGAQFLPLTNYSQKYTDKYNLILICFNIDRNIRRIGTKIIDNKNITVSNSKINS